MTPSPSPSRSSYSGEANAAVVVNPGPRSPRRPVAIYPKALFFALPRIGRAGLKPSLQRWKNHKIANFIIRALLSRNTRRVR
jgi:hypothetical protein